MQTATPAGADTIEALGRRALAIRRRVIQMVQALGHGYLGQGLGIADVLAALYFHEPGRDPEQSPGQSVDAWLADPPANLRAEMQAWSDERSILGD